MGLGIIIGATAHHISKKKDSMKLTYKKRQKMKDSDFALEDERKYPIDTKARARNALARVSQHGTRAEIKEVRREVHQRYPSIRISPRMPRLR
jgi:hypothetical protein